MSSHKEGSTISISVPLTKPDGTLFDWSVAYSGSVDGVVLNDDTKGSFKFTLEVKAPFTDGDGTAWAKGDIAKDFLTADLQQNVFMVGKTVDTAKCNVATVLNGLHGKPDGKAHYLLTVYTYDSGEWKAIDWRDIEVFGKPKLT